MGRVKELWQQAIDRLCEQYLAKELNSFDLRKKLITLIDSPDEINALVTELNEKMARDNEAAADREIALAAGQTGEGDEQ